MKHADHVFVQSEQMKKDIMAYGIQEKLLSPVPMGVPSDKLTNATSMSKRTDCIEEQRIVYLGTLARVRRIDFLIRVLARVKQTFPNATLYLVGSGPEPDDEVFLREEAASHNVSSSVTITGFLPMDEAWKEVSRASVCVSPFYPTPILNSTSPTKLIEYMALRKAVVANDHPEQKLVINESGAGICVPYEEAAFSQAIIKLLKNPELCDKMGEKGRHYVETNRSYPVIADKLDTILHQVFARQ
jgi:glycosyltransferase involved in cell wall biosynthesis